MLRVLREVRNLCTQLLLICFWPAPHVLLFLPGHQDQELINIKS